MDIHNVIKSSIPLRLHQISLDKLIEFAIQNSIGDGDLVVGALVSTWL